MPSPTRRQFLAATAVSAGLTGCLGDRRPDGDLGSLDGRWPMAGRDAGHTRRAPAGPTDPDRVWVNELDVRATGTPAVAGDRLYVPADAITDESRSRHRLYALAATTGETRWHTPLRIDVNGSPAVTGDRIVVSGKRSLERGRVVCVGSRYGEEEWLYDVEARLTAPPTIDDGVVYVPDWSGTVHALGVTDGSVLWSRRVEIDQGATTITNPVAVDADTLYVGSNSGKTGVVALDADTGETQWQVSTDAVTSGPVVHDGLVVVQCHSLVVALGTDGSRRWSFNLVEQDYGSMAVDERHVYAAGRDALVAITRDGKESWRYEISEGQAGAPTVAGDSVFVRTGDRLRSLSGTNGDEEWSTTADGGGEVVAIPSAIFLSESAGRVVGLGE